MLLFGAFFLSIWATLAVSFRTGPALTALAQAVPGYDCEGIQARVSSAAYSWSGGVLHATVGLTLPEPCLAELRRRLDIEHVMTAARCNVVDPCYKAERAGRWFELRLLAARTEPGGFGNPGIDAIFRYGDRQS